MGPLKVVLTAKDMGSHYVVSRLADKFDAEGHEEIVVAEGIAVELFQDDGRKLSFAGTRDFRDIPFSLDCGAFLEFHQPDVVVTGEGSPMYLERDMVQAANLLSIPAVAMDDYWRGAYRLLPARPDLICTVDEFSADITAEDFPEADIHIVGNPGARTLKASSEVAERMTSLIRANDHVIVFVGSGPATTDDIELLIECLEMTSGKWCLVPAFHPKHRDRNVPDGDGTYGELWEGMLAPLGERVVYVEGKGDDLVACATMVISHRSTLMTAAAYMGKVVISLETPAGIADNIDKTDSSKVPHVELGIAPLMFAPTDLSTFKTPDPKLVKRKIFPFDPNLAYDVIKDFLSKRDC